MDSVYEKFVLDSLLASDCDEVAGIEVSDSDFEAVNAEINDSIWGILGNLGIAVAEQKKLLQNAKTPSALNEALKALAVTSANIVRAGTGMLGWMGNISSKLNKR